ncbi:hypothetical protein [Achromobacter marplatensis]|uniref:hypothetical protein n=1 Tax=Achromobacter marplatensis TaxID=470868 RepID=UPI0028ED35B6|nr:hypothetical protein [Achromobacter marplatensis]
MPVDGVLSVREYITTPVDGTTSNQAGLVAAINAAVAAGARLFWPVGVYVSDANIPGFHSVQHVGPGKLKRGDDVFFVDPVEGQENVLYVRPTGAAANADGISLSTAISINRVSSLLLNYGPVLGGTWRVKLAAGTYVDGTTNRLTIGPSLDTDQAAGDAPKAKDTLLNGNYVIFEGPDVGYEPASNPWPTPAALFDGRGSSGIAFNFRGGFRAIVRDIKFQDYRGGGVAVTSGALRCENVHTSGCTYGISGLHSFLEVKGGWLYGSANKEHTGIRSLFLTKHDIGSQLAGAPGQGPRITNCNVGFLAQEGSTGHSDFVTYEDNVFAVNATVNARVNANGSSFKRNQVAVSTRLGAVVFTPGVEWSTGTVDANNDNMRCQTGQILMPTGPEAYAQTYEQVFVDHNDSQVTGTTTEAVMRTYPIAENRLTCAPNNVYKGKVLRIRASGTITGTNGSKAFRIRLGAASGLLVGGTIAATCHGSFILEASIYLTAPAAQKSWLRFSTAYGEVTARASTATSTIATASAEPMPLKLTCALANTADTVVVETFEVELTG